MSTAEGGNRGTTSRRERHPPVLGVDDSVPHRPRPADVDEVDPRRRLREGAAAKNDSRDVDLAQRFEDDLGADAGRIAEGDGEGLHGGILVCADDIEADGAGGGGELAIVGGEDEGLAQPKSVSKTFSSSEVNGVQCCKSDWQMPACGEK